MIPLFFIFKTKVLSMPVFCDHDSNTAKAAQDGYALKLDLETLTSDILLKGIIKIIHDPTFREAAKYYGR